MLAALAPYANLIIAAIVLAALVAAFAAPDRKP